ncbi:TadE/TadG family type IV pilus assembly protein [Sphingomonas sp. TZW2008]|uniref:TadE/TadG family type IV pilus assembly protein n=1 Tax=Sphingomonas sp. TZW2008 TaxID=1917973 RepID=UPI0015C4F0AE|nr:TadE family protein [Sphingomonas sp. TZW2008]
MIEFAIVLPVLLTLILYGIELANYVIVRQQVSQLAQQVADNASRIGVQEVLRNRPITEGQINDLFVGADLQAGNLNLSNNGRVILSSLVVNSDGGQWIQWQRCYGRFAHASTFGNEGDGATGKTLTGMGPTGSQVQAMNKVPLVFTEIALSYKPVISSRWAPSSIISEYASFYVRDDRDTSAIQNSNDDPVARCR